MRGAEELFPSNNALTRALRLTFGIALLISLFMILSAAGAFASSVANSSGTPSSSESPSKSRGLLSGILQPVLEVVDSTASQIPVIGDVTGGESVRTVATPVTTVTDRLEIAVDKVPVVGGVLVPVGKLTNTVAPPVVNAVEAVTVPVLKTVDEAAAPVVKIVAPVVDPVTGTLKPIVDRVSGGVSNGVSNVVDEVLTPTKPAAPGEPGMPAKPGGAVDLDAGITAPGQETEASAVQETEETGGSRRTDVLTSSAATKQTPLLTGITVERPEPKLTTTVRHAAAPFTTGVVSVPTAATLLSGATSTADVGSFAACGADADGPSVGPCAPAVSSGNAPGAASGAGSGGSGGPAAGHHHDADVFSVSLAGSAVGGTNWPLPASMPSDPGSTPG